MPSLQEEIYATFLASIRSVGTACTLASVGFYLHRRGFVVGTGKRTLALISQQVTIPLLFFTKSIYCNQDWSTDPCPDVTDSIENVWVLLIWPAYVVSLGFLVGWFIAKLSGTPSHQIRAVLVACGFGNSTGIPITLLTVVHTNFPADTNLGKIDPTLFLSVYLLLYPVLQWGLGGWLLAPPSSSSNDVLPPSDGGTEKRESLYVHARNVLNRKTSDSYNRKHRGMAEVDASMYMSVQDGLNTYASTYSLHQITQSTPGETPARTTKEKHAKDISPTESFDSIGMNLSRENSVVNIPGTGKDGGVFADPEAAQQHGLGHATEQTSLLSQIDGAMVPISSSTIPPALPPPKSNVTMVTINSGGAGDDNASEGSNESADGRLWETVKTVLGRCLQPPVVGALTGLLVASQPKLRGIFVNIVSRNNGAPLEWMFDGLYSVGQAAVPINMIILGCNLSASYSSNNNNNNNNKEPVTSDSDDDDENDNRKSLFTVKTMIWVVLGKMIIIPILGFLSAWVLYTLFWQYNIPKEIAGSFYLVVLIVFLTPTANNVMVMVELSGSGSKAGMARIIAWQYAVAPLLLSITMTVAVATAQRWSA